MYLTAQRVRAAKDGSEGINAFYHRHRATWSGPPPSGIPDDNPGELAARDVVIEPGGNRVRSYLDIIAPDGTAWSVIRESFLEFVSRQQGAFPWTAAIGSLRFVTSMDEDLASRWQQEVGALFAAAQRLGSLAR